MERPKEIPNANTSFPELDNGISSSFESFHRLLEPQKELFHSQIEQLHKIVVTQCKLTGVNPLSQEMAAGALSIKIGKRPRDLLNPKAIKYMQSIFCFKDTVTKKDARKISALCGVTVMQVRGFFSSQRTTVRKLVRSSHEKAIRLDSCKASQDGLSTIPDDPILVNGLVPEKLADHNIVEDGPLYSAQEEIISGIESFDKKFLENIFNLMRKEDTFSGQVKLMEWVLQIHNSTVLYWFLTKGGIMILAKWFSQAAVEEQTTLLLVIFKVLCHLPLHRALPVLMSAILQTVDSLRFYRTSDISNRARSLLTRWSKLLVRIEAKRKHSDAKKKIIREQRISEILSDETWHSTLEIPDEILALTNESSENCSKTEPPRSLKLLTASCDDSNKKQIRSVSSPPEKKERRKVLRVEQPSRKFPKAVQVSRAAATSMSTCRPMSADDIQKVKMKAIFMQSKHRKDGAVAQGETNEGMAAGLPARRIAKPLSNPRNVRRKLEKEHEPQRKPEISLENIREPEPSVGKSVSLPEQFLGNRITWHTPPEMRISCMSGVGAGEKSKEIEIQTERIRREKQTFYRSSHEIPADPREPWDVELDFDDTLTPEIPTSQRSDPKLPLTSNEEITDSSASGDTVEPPVIVANPTGPDLELLAVLLKNPDLVFALTSGQGKSITSDETVAMLDLLKAGDIGLAGILNGRTGMGPEKSPEAKPEVAPIHIMTPHACPSLNRRSSEYGALPEVPGDSVLPRTLVPSADPLASSFPSTPAPLPEKLPVVSLTSGQLSDTSRSLPQVPFTSSPMQQIPVTVSPPRQFQITTPPQKKAPIVSLMVQETAATRPIHLQIPVTGLRSDASMLPEQLPVPSSAQLRFRDTILPPQPQQRIPDSRSDPTAPAKNFPVSSSTPASSPLESFPARTALAQQPESWNSRRAHVPVNIQKVTPASFLSNSGKVMLASHLPSLLPTPMMLMPTLISEPPLSRPAWIHNSGPPRSREISDHRMYSGIRSFRDAGNQVAPAKGEKETRRGNSPVHNLQFPANRNDLYAFPATSAIQRPMLLNPPSEPELEMWSPERSPELMREFHSGLNRTGLDREFSPGWRSSRNSRPWPGGQENRGRYRRY